MRDMENLGKRARQKLERPIEILDAALEEFVRKGYASTRLEDVAKIVGVTKGTVYVYFETKEALFSAVVRHFAPALETAPIGMDDNRSTTDILAEYLMELHEKIAAERQSREIFYLLIANGRHFPELLDQYYLEFLAPAIDQLRLLLERAVEKGEFRPTELTGFPEILVAPSVLANVWTVVFGNRKPIDQKRFVRAYVEALFDAVRISEPSSPPDQGASCPA